MTELPADSGFLEREEVPESVWQVGLLLVRGRKLQELWAHPSRLQLDPALAWGCLM